MLAAMDQHRISLMRRWSSGLPEADAVWAELEADYGREESILECAVFTAFARLIVEWQERGAEADVAQALANTEELLRAAASTGDEGLRGLVSVCFLESLQNLALNGYADYDALEAHLGPCCRECWEEIERFWEGDAILAPQLLGLFGSALRFAGWAAGYRLLAAAPARVRQWLGKGRDA